MNHKKKKQRLFRTSRKKRIPEYHGSSQSCETFQVMLGFNRIFYKKRTTERGLEEVAKDRRIGLTTCGPGMGSRGSLLLCTVLWHHCAFSVYFFPSSGEVPRMLCHVSAWKILTQAFGIYMCASCSFTMESVFKITSRRSCLWLRLFFLFYFFSTIVVYGFLYCIMA